MNGVNSVQIITEMDFLRFDACACDSSVATAPSQAPFKDGSSRQKTLTLPSFTFFFIKSHVSEANTSYNFSSEEILNCRFLAGKFKDNFFSKDN